MSETRLPLPVIDTPGERPRKIAKSKAARWRAAVLILVHVAIGAHIVHWMIVGRTLSPVEPSDGMATLREGVLNAGFVMLALATLSTLILGRFFCGWACHVVALQDLCSWLLAKVKIRPKPFRSRLLIWAPTAAAFYMFFWPVVHREVVTPIFGDERGRLPVWLGQSTRPDALTTEFFVEDFWATFPPWYISVPFLGVCGFAVVYFLGAKGYCTYGCPYGGIFAPADKFSVGRIVVNPDKCDGNAHCTAVCTSNVRVHEEIRDFGMVMDPGCMKCMDCVSVCPTDALSFSFAKPAKITGPIDKRAAERAEKAAARRWDLTGGEEIGAGVLYLVLLVGFRSMFDAIPFLFALGLAGIGVYAALHLWWMTRRANLRLHGIQLRRKGRVTAGGAIAGVGMAAYVLAGVWGCAVNVTLWQARLAHDGLRASIEVVLRPDFVAPPMMRERAERSLALYDAGARLGWGLNSERAVQRAYVLAVLGRYDEALRQVRATVERDEPRASLVAQLEQLMVRTQASPIEIEGVLRDLVERYPELIAARQRLTARLSARGAIDDAGGLWDADDPALGSIEGRLALAGFEGATGRAESARALVDGVLDERHIAITQRLAAANVLRVLGRADEAERVVREVADEYGRRVTVARRVGPALASFGDAEAGTSLIEDAVERRPNEVEGLVALARLQATTGDFEGAKGTLDRAAGLLDNDPWELAQIAALAQQFAGRSRDREFLERAVSWLTTAIEAAGGPSVMLNDLAQLLLVLGETERALLTAGHAVGAAGDNPATLFLSGQIHAQTGNTDVAIMRYERVAMLDPTNPIAPQELARLLNALGRTDEAQRWAQEARRRAGGG